MKKIIHVDNSEFFRKLMRTFLASEGFEVESFSNGEDAGFAILGGSIAMVICGLALEDMDGITFIKKVNEFYDGPVVIVTANKSSDFRAQGAVVTSVIEKSGAWKESLRTLLPPK